jgi:hypothetical protein
MSLIVAAIGPSETFRETFLKLYSNFDQNRKEVFSSLANLLASEDLREGKQAWPAKQ